MNDIQRQAALDPITFEVIKNALSSAADEMALIIMRSAYSPSRYPTLPGSAAPESAGLRLSPNGRRSTIRGS